MEDRPAMCWKLNRGDDEWIGVIGYRDREEDFTESRHGDVQKGEDVGHIEERMVVLGIRDFVAPGATTLLS